MVVPVRSLASYIYDTIVVIQCIWYETCQTQNIWVPSRLDAKVYRHEYEDHHKINYWYKLSRTRAKSSQKHQRYDTSYWSEKYLHYTITTCIPGILYPFNQPVRPVTVTIITPCTGWGQRELFGHSTIERETLVQISFSESLDNEKGWIARHFTLIYV